jgi:hypothetical protein
MIGILEMMSKFVDGKQGKEVSWKSNLVPKCGYVKPFIKRGIWKSLIWEFLSFLYNSKLIPLPEPKKFMVSGNMSRNKHLKFFGKHLWLWIHIVMNLNLMQKLWA